MDHDRKIRARNLIIHARIYSMSMKRHTRWRFPQIGKWDLNMPKPRGLRHSWRREGEWATCINCGLKVETRLLRRGGLPTCEVIESKPQEIIQPGKPKSYLQEYLESYHKGCERYGVWWKLFTFSMLAIAMVFIAFAITLVVFFLW